MRYTPLAIGLAVSTAFVVGIVVSPTVQHLVSEAHAQPAASAPAALSAMIIDLAAIEHDDLGKTPNPELNNRMLVTTANATIQLQSGNVKKHLHPMTDEIQFIIEGSGSMWLGNERKDFKPGTLIVIPKGVAHAGSIVSTGPVKALAIKIPPQPATDTVFVD